MYIAEPLVREREYHELRLEVDTDHAVHWCFMHRQRGTAAANHRPCFHLLLDADSPGFLRAGPKLMPPFCRFCP